MLGHILGVGIGVVEAAQKYELTDKQVAGGFGTNKQENKMKHPHAAFLAEALKDTTRKIEARHPKYRDGDWITSELSDVIRSSPEWQFRFADTKPECVSPLTDDELLAVCNTNWKTTEEFRRAIANAAHRAAYKQVAELPAVTSFTQTELNEMYDDKDLEIRKFAAIVIDEFQRTLIKQLGE